MKKKNPRKLSVTTWLKTLKKISSVIHEIYVGLLHKALHMQNIIIRDKSHPKAIDLCQACLISDPIIYKTKSGFTKQAKYNKIHKLLVSELRNIPGSVILMETDLYTLGFIMNNVTSRINTQPLEELC